MHLLTLKKKKNILILNHRANCIINNPYNVCTLENTAGKYDSLALGHLNTEELKVKNTIKRYSTLFSKEGEKLTSTTEIEHEVLTTTEEQLNSKLYKYPQQHEEEVRKQIKEMEEQGIIRKSNSRYISPIIVI